MSSGQFYVEGRKERTTLQAILDAIAALSLRLNLLDGVHFNPVEGVAGTDWPIGTREMPVNNLTDVITLMNTHNVRKLYLEGARTLQGTHTAANNPTVMTDANNTFRPGSLVNLTIFNVSDGSSGVIVANAEHSIAVGGLIGGGANIWTTGDIYYVADALGNSPYRIVFNQSVDLDLVGNEFYDVIIGDGVVVTFTNGLVCYNLTPGTGGLMIMSDCEVCGSLDITGGGSLPVILYGSLRVSGHLNNTSDNTKIYGNCRVAGELAQDDNAIIEIYGNCQVASRIYNSGGSRVKVAGDLDIDGPSCDDGYLDNSDGLEVRVGGHCHIAQDIYNGGFIRVQGDCQVGFDIEHYAGGYIAVHGKLRVGGDLYSESEIDGCAIEFTKSIAALHLSSNSTSIQRVVSRGSLTVSDMVNGAYAMIDLCGGVLTIDVGCTGGTIDLYGDCSLVDNSGGAVTVNDYRIPGHSI
jgi:hypothetical protein